MGRKENNMGREGKGEGKNELWGARRKLGKGKAGSSLHARALCRSLGGAWVSSSLRNHLMAFW